jgi:stage V sporulation protein S
MRLDSGAFLIPDKFLFELPACIRFSPPKYHKSLTYNPPRFLYSTDTAKAYFINSLFSKWRQNMDTRYTDSNISAPQSHNSAANMIKVSATSRTSAVAGAIAGVVREHRHAEVQAIGAGAVNQAVKALVLATGYLKLDGINVTCIPEFADVTIEDKVRTAIKLVIDPE